MQIYGLFKMSYDYYEWEEFLFVSRSKKKLLDRAETMVKVGSKYDPQIILDMELEQDLKTYGGMKEEPHYQIRKLEVI